MCKGTVAKNEAAFEETWRQRRKDWSPLFSGFTRSFDRMHGWADMLLVESNTEGRIVAMKSIAKSAPLSAMVEPMLVGYVNSAAPIVLHYMQQELRDRFRKAARPDPAEEMAITSVYESGAQLVQGVSAATRELIQDAIAEGIANGQAIPTIARGIKDGIGLSRRDARAVRNYRERLEASDRSTSTIMRMVERYKKRKIKDRATTIARTEMVRARVLGREAAWEIGIAEGWVYPDEDLKEWITADPCPICQDLEGTTAKIGKPFTSANGQQYLRPPVHPNCRCDIVLKL